MSDDAAYDRYGEAFRDWMAPILAPAAVGLLDRLSDALGQDAVVDDGFMRLLDVGTGTGTLALAALERWPQARATAVDPSRLMLSLADAEARRRGNGLSDRLRLVQGGAEDLPLAEASVDVVVSSFVIQLAWTRSAALREIHRVLRPGGVAAILTWQLDDEPFAPDDAVADTIDELELNAPPADGGGGVRAYTSPAAAASELRRIGFERVRGRQEWLDHRFTPESYLGLVENWMEDDLLTELDAPTRARFRSRLTKRLEGLDADAFRWRRPLVSVVGRRR